MVTEVVRCLVPHGMNGFLFMLFVAEVFDVAPIFSLLFVFVGFPNGYG